MKRKVLSSLFCPKQDQTCAGPKEKKQKNQHPDVVIYWERIYRFVEKFEKLYGENVHVSKGELGSPSAEEYKLVPLSHMCELGALFEMEENQDEILDLTCKQHQAGTGIAEYLSPANAPITRIIYDPSSIEAKLESKITELAKTKNIETVKIDHLYLMTDGQDKIQLSHLSKPKLKV